MGQVWQATDTQLNRQVALKILPDAFADDSDRLARFQREAQILASLNHPGIASIHGIEESEGTRALVLELVEGPTLADRIAQGAIPIEDALPIAKQIAEALEAAHEAGVIHRDLKPANIKVREDGTVKVLDFGLAKALDLSPEGDPSQSPTLTAAATQMGVIMGTAAYMSPEQARGKVVDKRADIWAFGCVLYEMLTGQRAFRGEDVSLTLASVMKSDLNVTRLPYDLPATVRTVLHRCLEKDPSQRIRDIGDVRLAMAGAFETMGPGSAEPTASPPKLRPWQRPVPMLAIVLVAVLVTGFAVRSLTRPAPGRLARFSIPLLAGQDFTGRGTASARAVVAMSPDGAHIVYAADDNLWLRPVAQRQATIVSGTESASGPFFSADSQSIGFWADGRLRKVAVSGGAPVTIADIADDPDGASWGDDGMILYGSDGGILRVAGASGVPEVLIPLESPEAHGPQMLPGGEWVLYTLRSAGPGTWGEAQVAVQSIATGERTVLFDGRDARYLATGHLVYVLESVLFAVPFDAGAREVIGGPVPLVEDVADVGTTGGAAHFGVSGDGALVYVPRGQGLVGSTLTWLSLSGEETMTATPVRVYRRTRVSPDGTQIAVDVLGEDGNADIWIWRFDDGPLTRLTFDEAATSTRYGPRMAPGSCSTRRATAADCSGRLRMGRARSSGSWNAPLRA